MHDHMVFFAFSYRELKQDKVKVRYVAFGEVSRKAKRSKGYNLKVP